MFVIGHGITPGGGYGAAFSVLLFVVAWAALRSGTTSAYSDRPGAAAGDIPASNFVGQIVGIVTFVLLGFVPGYGLSFIMKQAGWLRVPDHIQKAGIDKAELGLQAYHN